MSTKRRSYETGHKPKCLVIVDDTAEWDRAVYYASRWAMRAGGGVVMLHVIETEEQNQQWLGVADIMRAEAHENANAALDRAAAHLKDELMPKYAEAIYYGFWFSPEREMLQAAIDKSQKGIVLDFLNRYRR